MAHFLLGRERKAAEEKQYGQDPTAKLPKKMRRRLRQKEHNVLEQQPSTSTQIPARREVVGLQNLVYMYLGMRLDKSCQLANEGWERNQLDENCTM